MESERNINSDVIFKLHYEIIENVINELVLWCLMSISTIFQLFRGV